MKVPLVLLPFFWLFLLERDSFLILFNFAIAAPDYCNIILNKILRTIPRCNRSYQRQHKINFKLNTGNVQLWYWWLIHTASGGGLCEGRPPLRRQLAHCTLFARLIPSDNGPQFTSEAFRKLTTAKGVKYVTGAPYHPATNGQAEKLVQSFKKGGKHNKSGRTLQHKLDRILLAYWSVPCATTYLSPAQLLLGRDVRTRLDLIKPDVIREVNKKLFSPRASARSLLFITTMFEYAATPEDQIRVWYDHSANRYSCRESKGKWPSLEVPH